MSNDLRGLASLWLNAERLRENLVAFAELVAPHGVELLAIKGLHLAYAVAKHPWFRPFADADCIVVQGQFESALALARNSGRYEVFFDSWVARRVVRREDGACIDLQKQATVPFVSRLTPARLRARATRHPALGPHVLCPDPHDAAAIAIAHFLKDRLGAFHYGKHLSNDLALLAAHAHVSPNSLAVRLVEHGLRRAGLVAFRSLARNARQFDAWAQALEPSRNELRWADFVVTTLPKLSRSNPKLAFVLARSVADSPHEIARAVALGGAWRLGLRWFRHV